jgi:hypothetical protein
MKAEIRVNQERFEDKIEATWREFKTQLKEIQARAECGRGTGTGAYAAKPPKFDGTTSLAVFQRQIETVTEHNCWTRLEKSTYLITAILNHAKQIFTHILIRDHNNWGQFMHGYMNGKKEKHLKMRQYTESVMLKNKQPNFYI